jgi:hypothetical protein
MPRKRRRLKLRHVRFTDGKRLHLLNGSDMFGDGYGYKSPDLELMRADWVTHRNELIDEQMAKQPGTRPWAYWEFEKLAERPRLVFVPKKMGRLLELKDGRIETQFDYLKRHGLLTPEEKTVLGSSGNANTARQ